MNPAEITTSIEVRHYRDDDEPEVLELLAAALGGGPTGSRDADFFRWKHSMNPFGRSFMLVAQDHGRIVGLRAFMRWRFETGQRAFRAVRAVDTATHPEYQGQGVFSHLTREALRAIRDEAEIVFNTPNEKSGPGYLKLGWHLVGRVPVSIRVRRPLRFLRHARRWRTVADSSPPPIVAAETATAALHDEDAVTELLRASWRDDRRLSTPRDVGYLRWRFGEAPSLDYRVAREVRGGRLQGLAIFRVRPRGRLWETSVAELVVPPGDRRTTARLLHAVAAAAPTDHITGHFAPDSPVARRARSLGFLFRTSGPTFVVNPLGRALHPIPTELGSWSLSLGDLEVF